MRYAAKTGEPQQGEPATRGCELEMWRFYSSIITCAVSLRLTSLKIEYYCNEIEYNFSDLNLETMNITHYIKSKLIIFIKDI